MVLSMPVLPDCAACGCPVVLELDHEDPVEVCVGCGIPQSPQPPVGWQQEWRRKVRVVHEKAKRGELPC